MPPLTAITGIETLRPLGATEVRMCTGALRILGATMT
jgi:hypothetical protein